MFLTGLRVGEQRFTIRCVLLQRLPWAFSQSFHPTPLADFHFGPAAGRHESQCSNLHSTKTS